MEFILDEIRATFNCGIWYPVVSSVLMMPDACGAIECWGQAGKTSKMRYIEWYDKWVLPHFQSPKIKFDGEVVYIVRNAMIHETTAFTRGKHGFDRILFTPPNVGRVVIEFCFYDNNCGVDETAFQITILGIMNAMETGVRNWLDEVRGDTDKRREAALDKLIQFRQGGLSPHIIGIPVVS